MNLQSVEVLGFLFHSSLREDSAELRFRDNLMFIAALASTYQSTQSSSIPPFRKRTTRQRVTTSVALITKQQTETMAHFLFSLVGYNDLYCARFPSVAARLRPQRLKSPRTIRHGTFILLIVSMYKRTKTNTYISTTFIHLPISGWRPFGPSRVSMFFEGFPWSALHSQR